MIIGRVFRVAEELTPSEPYRLAIDKLRIVLGEIYRDKKVLDEVLFKKFGISKSGEKSRMNSINWYINKMVKKGMFEV